MSNLSTISSATLKRVLFCSYYRGVHLTRQDLSFLTRLVVFNKICLFRQDLFFRRQILSFSTRLVFFNNSCLFRHAVKQQLLSKKTRFVVEKTNLVEKDDICRWKNKSCRKKQVLSKKTNLVVLDERRLYLKPTLQSANLQSEQSGYPRNQKGTRKSCLRIKIKNYFST